MIPILFLAADPTDASRLRLGEEIREIQEKLQLARLREQFNIAQRLSTRASDISQALLDVDPEIVHFSGHGTTTGEICVESNDGTSHFIDQDALTALFEQFANRVKCVVLNACYSAKQAAAIATHVQHVIGMNTSIGDKAAIAFSVGFYQALGAGRSIEEAYQLGCVQIRLQGIPEHLTPVLIKKNSFSPVFAKKSYQFPGGYEVLTMRKNRTYSSDPLDRQRIGLVTLGDPTGSWHFLALIESVGEIEWAIQATSSAAQLIREFVESFVPVIKNKDLFNPKEFLEACVLFADVGVKHQFEKFEENNRAGLKIALAVRLNDVVHVACVGECGALLRWKRDDDDCYRNVRNRSYLSLELPKRVMLEAPVGHLLCRDKGVAEIDIEPVLIAINEPTAFVILTSHQIHTADDNIYRDMIEQISSQKTMNGIAQYLCEVQGAEYEECMVVGLYRNGEL